MRPFPSFWILIAAAGVAFAQTSALTGDGRRPVEKPGIALVKPQKWSSPAEAQPVRFTAYTNRGGYFVLRLPNGQDRQVWVAQMVGEAPVVRPDLPSELVETAGRDALAARLDEIQALARQAPAAKSALDALSKPLAEMLARFDAGEVYSGGKWEPADSHRTRQFDLLESRLRGTLALEQNLSQFNLAENSTFRKLRELAAATPTLQPRLEKLRADHERLVSLQRQADLLKQLAQPSLTDSAAADLLNRLRAYPDPSERTALVLEQAKTAALLSTEAASIQKNLEEFFTKNSSPASIPALPSDLSVRIETLADEMRKFQAASPPAGLKAPIDSARAFTGIGNDLPRLSTLVAKREWVDVATLANRLEPQAALVGPAARGAFLRLKTEATSKVDLFSKLRSEGEEAESQGDPAAAAAKFQEALAILPDPDLQSRLTRLQTPTNQPAP